MDSPSTFPFCDAFDAAMAAQGPPAVFTLDPEGLLRLHVDRTRDAWRELGREPVERAACHCLYRDRATGFVQYVYATGPELVGAHPRAEIARYPDREAAFAALQSLGRPPVSDRLPQPPR